MRRAWLLGSLLVGCWSSERVWIVQGTVLEHPEPGKIIVDHEAVPGLMDAMVMPFRADDAVIFKDLSPGAMVMPFRADDAVIFKDLSPGDKIVARLSDAGGSYKLVAVRVTGHGEVPASYVPRGGGPIHAGAMFPPTEVPLATGASWRVGQAQGVPTLLTFLYTTCPLPEFCPMVASRLAALQAQLKPGEARLLAVTIDPAHDTNEVLRAYGEKLGADGQIWQFGRLEPDALAKLASHAGLPVLDEGREIVHGLRWLVLDAAGRLIERYDDNAWPADRLLNQLKTGRPPAPPGSDGTISRPPQDAETPAAAPAR